MPGEVFRCSRGYLSEQREVATDSEVQIEERKINETEGDSDRRTWTDWNEYHRV